MASIHKEPLVHFLCIGALIFLLYSLFSPQIQGPDASNEIVISAGDIERLSQDWARKWNRSPSSEKLEDLVEARIHEEVYYREALALGLDRDDAILRRRLMQKMEFLTNDLSVLEEPDEATLRDYLHANADDYRQPTRASFRQIYFSRDRRGDMALQDADKLLAALHSKPVIAQDSHALGDPFMHPDRYEHQSPDEVARVFGGDFAAQLFATEVGSWQGPIVSGYGLHLLRIDEMKAAQLPELEDVIDDVRRDWLFAQRQRANKNIYQRLRSRYQIRVDQGGTLSDTVATTVTEKTAS